jgi:hypothetical protein
MFMYDPTGVPLMRPGVPALAFRYVPDVGFQLLPAVKPLEVSYREGARPSVAAFTYVSGNTSADSYPIWIEHVLPMATIGNPFLVYPDDRIVIATVGSDGLRFLFDGYAQIPEVSWSDRRQDITFQAQGVEVRAWDNQMTGYPMRNAGNYANAGATNTRFVEDKIIINPVIEREARGNMLIPGHGYDAENPDTGREFLPWVDPLVNQDITYTGEDGQEVKKSWRQLWTLAEAVNTILAYYNNSRDIIAVPNRDYILNELVVITPKSGDFYDPEDSSTYTARDIILPETDLTDMSWPAAIEQICKRNGIMICFRLATSGGLPKTYLDIYRLNKPDRSNFKDIYLQPSGSDLDPAINNVSQGRLATDTSGIINQVVVRTAPVRYEAGLILAPLFKIDLVNDFGNKDKFSTTKEDADVSTRIYRWFGVDECGEGHSEPSFGFRTGGLQTFDNWNWSTTAFDLSPILGLDLDGNPNYAERRRPTLKELWSKDKDGEYKKFELYVSVDYSGQVPAVWDGKSGIWYRVYGGFKPLDDRLGIRVTQQKPDEWNKGKADKGVTYPTQISGGTIKTISWMSNPDVTQRLSFTLMLVCAFDGDHPLPVLAGKRDTSSTVFEITRVVDMADKLRPGIIHPSSRFHPDLGQDTAEPIEAGNTEDDAYGYALNKREVHQYGVVAGDIIIRRITYAYQIGDRIRQIAGRNASLRINRGGELEGDIYPRIVGITYKVQNINETQLVLSDQRADSTD